MYHYQHIYYIGVQYSHEFKALSKSERGCHAIFPMTLFLVFTLLEKVVVVCRDGTGDTDTEISQQRQFDPSRYEKCGRGYPFYLVPIIGYISKYRLLRLLQKI